MSDTHVYVIQGDYGYGDGWEDVNAETTKEDAQRSLSEYNGCGVGIYRIVKRKAE